MIALGDTTCNVILKIINHMFRTVEHTYNLKESNLDEDDPWKGIIKISTFKSSLPLINLKVKYWDNLYLD